MLPCSCYFRLARHSKGTLGKLCAQAHPLYIIHCCISYVHAVFATSFTVGSNPIGPPRLCRTRTTTSAGGRDAAGTGKFLTFLSRERDNYVNTQHFLNKMHMQNEIPPVLCDSLQESILYRPRLLLRIPIVQLLIVQFTKFRLPVVQFTLLP